MYYDRTLNDSFAKLLMQGGSLRWLFDFVKSNSELDFLIGKNGSDEWISVYRGLTRILTLQPTSTPDVIKIKADKKYKLLEPAMFGNKSSKDKFQSSILNLITEIKKNHAFDRYYENEKEGYFQNELSRKYGICGDKDDPFVIIDKEVVIGYKDEYEKENIIAPYRNKYKGLQKDISLFDEKRYGKDLEKKSIGNELDFLALDDLGNILLIEYKHGTNTSGIYLSPLQIGMYYDIFNKFPKKDLDKAILNMLDQKQKIGLINPLWSKPQEIRGIVPVLIISEYNYKSSAKCKFREILSMTRQTLGSDFLNDLRIYNYTRECGLTLW